MNNLKLATSNDVELFLRILAEESAKKSRQSIAEDSGREEQRAYSRSISSDLKKFSETLDEEDDAPGEETSQQISPSSEMPDVATADELEDEEEPLSEELPENITTTDIITLINFAREAPSTKDYKDQLSAYIDDILDSEERLLVYLFLDQITKIMHGSIRGSDAKDPSEPPSNFNIVHGEKSQTQSSPPQAATSQSIQAISAEPSDEPPIRVGAQRVAEIRKVVNELMA